MNKKIKFKSQAARDAQRMNYGDLYYWEYLDESCIEHSKYYNDIGNKKLAKEMLTRSLVESLQGNDGN